MTILIVLIQPREQTVRNVSAHAHWKDFEIVFLFPCRPSSFVYFRFTSLDHRSQIALVSTATLPYRLLVIIAPSQKFIVLVQLKAMKLLAMPTIIDPHETVAKL